MQKEHFLDRHKACFESRFWIGINYCFVHEILMSGCWTIDSGMIRMLEYEG